MDRVVILFSKGKLVGVSTGGFSVQQLDLLLNELDQLAQSAAPRLKFYSALLERLRFVCSATSAAFIIPMDGQRWGVVAASGANDFHDFLAVWNQQSIQPDPDTESPTYSEPIFPNIPNGNYLAAYASPKQPRRGAVVVKLLVTPDPAAKDEILSLCQAFSELICVRQAADMDDFLNAKLPAFHGLINSLVKTESFDHASTQVVNDLLTVLEADRISLIQRSLMRGDHVVAVSGATSVVDRAEAVESIAEIGSQVLESGKSITHIPDRPKEALEDSSPSRVIGSTESSSKSNHTLASNYVAFPLGRPSDDSEMRFGTALLVEWKEFEGLLKSSSLMNSVIPTLNVIWSEHERWLQTPRFARKVAISKLRRSIGSRSGLGARLGLAAISIFLIALILAIPIDFRIEMEGILEPESQRTVFASQDGIVSQILVSDSDVVKQGQLLVAMRSPALEIQIQETLGELKANSEKRDALSLSINQLARDSSTSSTTLNRISSELKQLETVKQTFEQKLEALREEESRLKIESPIDGVVVARDLKQLLDSRPLRRGDALFRIVNTDGPWRLQLSIADSDIGYVKQQVFGNAQSGGGALPAEANRGIEFILTSKPDMRFEATLTWLSDAARNPRGTGVSLDAFATVHNDARQHSYVGATAHAFMLCGRRPIWFVFSRPLVESIQRKLWF